MSEAPTIEPRKRRRIRRATLGCLAVVVVLGAFGWRHAAIFWCWGVARYYSPHKGGVVAWNCGALARLGPKAIPAMRRLVECPDIERAYPGGAGLYCLFRDRDDARDDVRALLRESSPRVRAVAAMIMISGPWHEPDALPAILENLSSDDRDVRVFSAYYLTYYPGDRFENDVKDAPQVFMKMVAILHEAVDDERSFDEFSGISGTSVMSAQSTVGSKASYGLQRLDARFTEKPARESVLAPSADAKRVWEEAKKKNGPFFTGDQSSGTIKLGK